LTARGGKLTEGSGGGCGGGGRIAVQCSRLYWTYTNQVDVAGETDYVYGDPGNVNGKTGTVYWLVIPPPQGTVFTIR